MIFPSYINKLIYSIGIQYHNPIIIDKFKFLQKSQYWDKNEINRWQIFSCKNLLFHAKYHSIFHKELFRKANFDPENFTDLKQLEDIPIVSKQDLLEHKDVIQNFVKHEKHFYSETSGSSGHPLVFYRNATWEAWHNASVMRGYLWHNVYPWERNGYLWGYNFSFKRKIKIKFLDFVQNRFRLFTYDNDEIKIFVKKLQRSVFLGGYSSMIYEIAKSINKMDPRPKFNLKLIKGTSEKIFPIYQNEVMKAFGTSIISEYGSAEGGIIAFECPKRTQHINAETAIVENVDDKIIVTNLFSHSFPIIRYQLGDYIKLSTQKNCLCGIKHPAIEEIYGRVGKVIFGKNKRYPSLTLYYVFKNLAAESNIVLNYQAKQTEKGKLTMLIEQMKNDFIDKALRNELHKYFDIDLDFDIQYNTLLKSQNKKKIDFISSLSEY